MARRSFILQEKKKINIQWPFKGGLLVDFIYLRKVTDFERKF